MIHDVRASLALPQDHEESIAENRLNEQNEASSELQAQDPEYCANVEAYRSSMQLKTMARGTKNKKMPKWQLRQLLKEPASEFDGQW